MIHRFPFNLFQFREFSSCPHLTKKAPATATNSVTNTDDVMYRQSDVLGLHFSLKNPQIGSARGILPFNHFIVRYELM